MNIIIAEELPEVSALLETLASELGSEVENVSDEDQLFERVEHGSPDIVFLDTHLTAFDGFAAAKKIKQMKPRGETLVVFLSTCENEQTLSNCLHAGGDDFIIKPFSPEVVRGKLLALYKQLQLYRTTLSQRDELRRRDEYSKQEQLVAKKVFDNILKTGCLHASSIESHVSPISLFNGDIVLAAARANGAMCALIGDLTGTGLSAALGGLPVSEVFYSMVRKGFAIDDIMIEISRKLQIQVPDDMSMRACILELDSLNGVLKIWNGGIPSAYLFRKKDAEVVRTFPSLDIPIGCRKNQKIQCDIETVKISDGDQLFFATDGLINLHNVKGEQYGEKRLEEAMRYRKDSRDLMSHVLSSVALFKQDTDQVDDLTILIITADKQVQSTLEAGADIHHEALKNSDWDFNVKIEGDLISNLNVNVVSALLCKNLMGNNALAKRCSSIVNSISRSLIDHAILRLPVETSSANGLRDKHSKSTNKVNAVLNDSYIMVEMTRSESSPNIHELKVSTNANVPDKPQLSSALTESLERVGETFTIEFAEQGCSVNVPFDWGARRARK